MSAKRKRHSAQFKFKAVAAMKEDKALNQLAAEYSVHPGQIGQWKRQLLNEGAEVFGGTSARQKNLHVVVFAKVERRAQPPEYD